MEPKFLYMGSKKDNQIYFSVGKSTQHPILSFPHTCAFDKIAIAALMALDLDTSKYYLEEYQGSLIFNMEKEIEPEPVHVYMIPFHHNFQKIEPEYKHIWISRYDVWVVDKFVIENPIQFAKNSNILVKINS